MARRKSKDPPNHRASGSTSLPGGFEQRVPITDDVERAALVAALSTASPVSIRLNPNKPFMINAEPVPWCASGRYLSHRPAFTLDPLLHAGAYYVQEASSMLLEQAVLATGLHEHDVIALDLCAAPGGKSTHLLSLLTPDSLLVANEIHAERRSVLAENCWKHGSPNVVIAGSRAGDLGSLASTFDLILLDAPCSGEGMFRKDPFARAQWSPKLVERCAAAQRDLVKHAWQALSPGGSLVYSTCTWEPMENEAQVGELVAHGGECLELPIDPAWGVQRSEVHGAIGYRCYPHRMRGEGFFLSVVRKPGHLELRESQEADKEQVGLPWVKPSMCFESVERNGILYGRPAAWSRELDRMGASLRITAPGLPYAERKGDGWAPHAALALSNALDRSTAREVGLSRPDALRFLRGEALMADGAEGMSLASFEGIGLGWMHGAGTRWNNRWPPAWRIRMHASEAAAVPWSKQ
ncbi:MAG: rRNA methyltransferase [Flavobacteriales bacterium]|nr:rRNA methyltransferase [Flavobacteriales bacterium]